MIDTPSGSAVFLDGRSVFRMSRGPMKSSGKALGKRTIPIFRCAGSAGVGEACEVIVLVCFENKLQDGRR